MYNNSKVAKAIRLAMMFGAGAAASIAAPTIAAEEGAEESVERIEVTGSRIKRTDLETSSPIITTTAADIKTSGFTRMEDVLNTLPQVEAAETSFLSNGATGNATLDLRGLGSNRTLVLVNGRRLQPGGINSQAADINQIPAALVERVDVLTGGASSTYGADAVAGVVNFIMKKDFEGLKLDVGVGGYQHDNGNKYVQGLLDEKDFVYPSGNSGVDGKSYNIDLTLGSDFAGGKGNATAYVVWRKNEEMIQGQRDYSSCALNGAGNSCGGSANTIIPHFDMFPVRGGNLGEGGAVDYTSEYWGEIDANSNFIPDTGTRYNYAPINHFMRPNERITFGTFVDYEINDTTNLYVELNYMNDRTDGQIAESGTFFNEEYVLDYNNPYMNDAQKAQLQQFFGQGPDEQFVAYIGKRNVEGGPRSDGLQHDSYRIVTGLEGELTDDWSYDVNFQYGSTSSSSVYVNDFLGPEIGPRIGAVGTECVDDCLPYQVWTYQGITAEQAAQLGGTAAQTGVVSQLVLSGYVSGDLNLTIPSAESSIAAVFGAEYREVDYERISDTVYEKGLLLGQGGPSASLFGEFDVAEVFGELSIPLVEDAPFVKSLTVDLGGRYSDYSTTGGDTTYKVGVDWTPVDDWKLRASMNRAVRAPNVGELFSAQNIGLWSGDDNCAGNTPSNTQSQCANTGLTATQYGNITASPAGQYNQFSGGNQELQPEEADTITFGVVASPFEGFNFSVDYFDIQMEKGIGTVGASRILQTCAETGDARFCDNVRRSPSGSLWLGQEGLVNNLIDNVGSRHWTGVDISANYSMDLGAGSLNFALNGSVSVKKEYEPITGLSDLAYDCSGTVSVDCFAQPDWRHTASVSYAADIWSVTGKWRYYGEVDYDGTTDQLLIDNGGIEAYNFFDLAASVNVTENITLQAVVNNILDEEPPLVGNTLSSNANTVAGFYDSLGRYLHVSATFTF
jgi:outer membrane receptor protein involved in Fe transport